MSLVDLSDGSPWTRAVSRPKDGGVVTPISPGRVWELYQENFTDLRREQMFLSAAGFLAAFGITRATTGWSHRRKSRTSRLANRVSPPRLTGMLTTGRGIHHYVYGVSILLASGYAWLFLGKEDLPGHRQLTRATSCLYGVGSALTLDEANLMLNLKGNYWKNPQRRWIDGAVIGIAVLSLGAWGRPFFGAVMREMRRNGSATTETTTDGGPGA